MRERERERGGDLALSVPDIGLLSYQECHKTASIREREPPEPDC